MFKQTDFNEIELRLFSSLVAALGLDPGRKPEVGHEGFTAAPNVGTYWQDRERPVRFFFLISKHECEGHTHMRMLRVDHARGGEYEFVYENDAQWSRSFKRVAQVDVPGNTVASRTVVLMDRGTCKVSFDGGDAFPASEMTDDQLNTVVAEHGEAHPGLRDFLEEQRPQLRIEFPAEEARKQVEAYRAAFDGLYPHYEPGKGGVVGARSALDGVPQYMQQFLAALDFIGTESPPAVGERYFSWISGATYKVVDVRRKLHQTDYYVTMEREPDGRRAKYTYRNHATWLTTWRPVDDEGNARQVEMVDVPTTAIDMTLVDSNDMRRVEPGDFLVDPEVELRRLYRELDRKVPSWREAGDGDHVFLDNASLAIRAIRSLHKHVTGYQRGIDALKEAIARRDETLAENSKNRRKDTDTLRDAVVVFSKMFAEQFGREALKQQVVAMNATSVANLPFDQIVPFMQRCRLYASRHEG